MSKRISTLLLRFIQMTNQQILYLQLIKEDQWNPWLDMARAVS